MEKVKGFSITYTYNLSCFIVVRINKARPNSADSQSAQNRRGAGRGKKGAGRGNSKGPNNKKKGPVTGQDLDKELDSCKCLPPLPPSFLSYLCPFKIGLLLAKGLIQMLQV